jgi:hypothetical protein
LFNRLLQKADVIPAEGDYLSQGKKALPISVLTNTCKKHNLVNTPYPYPPSHKGGGKGKRKDGKSKVGTNKGGKRLPTQASSSVAKLWRSYLAIAAYLRIGYG